MQNNRLGALLVSGDPPVGHLVRWRGKGWHAGLVLKNESSRFGSKFAVVASPPSELVLSQDKPVWEGPDVITYEPVPADQLAARFGGELRRPQIFGKLFLRDPSVVNLADTVAELAAANWRVCSMTLSWRRFKWRLPRFSIVVAYVRQPNDLRGEPALSLATRLVPDPVWVTDRGGLYWYALSSWYSRPSILTSCNLWDAAPPTQDAAETQIQTYEAVQPCLLLRRPGAMCLVRLPTQCATFRHLRPRMQRFVEEFTDALQYLQKVGDRQAACEDRVVITTRANFWLQTASFAELREDLDVVGAWVRTILPMLMTGKPREEIEAVCSLL